MADLTKTSEEIKQKIKRFNFGNIGETRETRETSGTGRKWTL